MRMAFIPIPTPHSDQKAQDTITSLTLKSESMKQMKKIRLTFS